MDTTILSNIGFQLWPGEHMAILGPNGSGKTTLLNTITGYGFFSTGTLAFNGHTYGQSDWTELRKSIGVVSASLHSKLNGAQPALETVLSGKNAMLGYCPATSPKDRSKASRLLQDLNCSALINRAWRKLSQGEKQRVLIARALMANAGLLILDEPCAGLDPVARERLLSDINHLIQTKKKPSIILVTHHVEEIMPGFTHALLLKHGRILESGAKSKVLNTANLKMLYDIPLRLSKRDGRIWMNIRLGT